jgi:hypothetical protein
MHTARWVALTLLGMTALVAAQAPLSQEPRYAVAFENTQFRILNMTVPPKDATLEHRHDRDLVTLSMMLNPVDTRTQSGAIGAKRPLGHTEITEYSGKPSAHRLENLGDAAYRLLAVENMKTDGWSTTPAVSAPGTQLTQESRAFRVYNVNLGRDRPQTSHTHAMPTLVILLNGKVMSDGPGEKAKANAPAPVGLKQLDGPGQWLLVPAGDTHHLVRLGSDEGRLVEIEVR